MESLKQWTHQKHITIDRKSNKMEKKKAHECHLLLEIRIVCANVPFTWWIYSDRISQFNVQCVAIRWESGFLYVAFWTFGSKRPSLFCIRWLDETERNRNKKQTHKQMHIQIWKKCNWRFSSFYGNCQFIDDVAIISEFKRLPLEVTNGTSHIRFNWENRFKWFELRMQQNKKWE